MLLLLCSALLIFLMRVISFLLTWKIDFTACSAVFSTFERHLPQVHNLINEHIAQSFVYSIMSSHFDTDAENRLGFGKYLADLADTMWNNAVEIVKYTGKRGGSVAPLMDNSSGTGLRISGDVRKLSRAFLFPRAPH